MCVGVLMGGVGLGVYKIHYHSYPPLPTRHYPHPPPPTHSYILNVTLKDYSSEKDVTLFQEAGEALMGCSAEVFKNMKEQNPVEMEDVVRAVVGTRRLFKFKVGGGGAEGGIIVSGELCGENYQFCDALHHLHTHSPHIHSPHTHYPHAHYPLPQIQTDEYGGQSRKKVIVQQMEPVNWKDESKWLLGAINRCLTGDANNPVYPKVRG